MKFFVIKFDKLQDLLLCNFDKMYRLGNRYLNATVAENLAVFWLVEHQGKIKRFVHLNEDLTIESRDTPQHGYIPVVDVTSMKAYNDLSWLET